MNRNLPTLAIIIILLLSACTPPTPAPPLTSNGLPITLALVNATLIDGTGADPLPNSVILIAGDKIAAIGSTGNLSVPAGVTSIDLGGAAVLPGFINAHVHHGFDKPNLQAWAQGGVTTVRDEGASSAQVANLRDFRAEVESDPAYARLVSAGVMLAVPGGYGNLFVNSAEEAREAVLGEVSLGVDAIKVAMEDGYSGTSGLPKLTPEELQAIVTTAHEKGLPVSGHITQGEYIQPLLEAGVDDIAHLAYDHISTDVLEQMVIQDIYFIPTFTVFRNYGAPVLTVKNNLRQFIELGGKVALGNDYGGGPGAFELGIPMYEIKMMSEAGMTPMQVIQACTLNAAHVLRLDAEIGTLEAGKRADILVVDGNPLDDLQTLANMRLVIHNGMVIRNEFED
jgi:imidazolonepropionase-like amidohydrolase